ncbi:MAG: LUD domain-containing protein [Chitinophagaceae bacterium]|nr:LUD domain-containing protein [Chitinophagaceae bacterium]
MSSREKILEAVLQNQPEKKLLPEISILKRDDRDAVPGYMQVMKAIGGSVYLVADLTAVKILINEHFDIAKRVVTSLPELTGDYELLSPTVAPHTYDDIELAVLRGHFGVAENAAVWLTDELMVQRIIPYICQHLAIVITAQSIVPTLHEAYEKIGQAEYGFGAFIGGPSKTADIEQALVLGAHGPLSMTVFILQ